MSEEAASDGRHARRSASRIKIVSALKELVQHGNISPRAPQVAERAGSGLRTSYRCLDDMEALYAACSWSGRRADAEARPL